MDREDVNEDPGNYGDEPYEENDNQAPKRKRGRPKGSTKTSVKKPKAELGEGEIKVKMGRAWYAVNDSKREFRYFTGLQEGEVPCSKKEEKEVKKRLNGYTRLLSNGRNKVVNFEEVDKDQQEQDLHQQEAQNFEHMGYQNEYAQQEYQNYAGNQEEYPNTAQEYHPHMYQAQHMYHNQTGTGEEYNHSMYQGEYPAQEGTTYNEQAVYPATGQEYQGERAVYQQTATAPTEGSYPLQYNQQAGTGNGEIYQQHHINQQQHHQQPETTTYAHKSKNDDDEEYQPDPEEN